MRDPTLSMHAKSKKRMPMAGQPWYASATPGVTQKIEDARERLAQRSKTSARRPKKAPHTAPPRAPYARDYGKSTYSRINEVTANGQDVATYGLLRGEKIFVCGK